MEQLISTPVRTQDIPIRVLRLLAVIIVVALITKSLHKFSFPYPFRNKNCRHAERGTRYKLSNHPHPRCTLVSCMMATNVWPLTFALSTSKVHKGPQHQSLDVPLENNFNKLRDKKQATLESEKVAALEKQAADEAGCLHAPEVTCSLSLPAAKTKKNDNV